MTDFISVFLMVFSFSLLQPIAKTNIAIPAGTQAEVHVSSV